MTGGEHDPGDLIEVEMRGLPLEVQARARQHVDELQREFMLIHHGQPYEHGEVPRRLLELVEELRGRFGAFTDATYAEIDAAHQRGQSTIDVSFTVPRAAVPAARALGAMLDEADEYCRSGALLTLATPAELVTYRRWFLSEFERQADGEPPHSWQAFLDAS